jgi:hypothetical protein
MEKWVRYTVLAVALLLVFATFHGLCSGDEQDGERLPYRGGSQENVEEKGYRNRASHLIPVTNQTYKEVCGACHFAYQAGLLPSGSWTKLLSNLKDHFGESVDIDASSKGAVEKYLIENAAEKSQWKRSRKIVRCLKGETPLRITEVPYIRRKHRDIAPEVFTRKAVGSLSSCSACHKTAEQGIYEDDYVTIPK